MKHKIKGDIASWNSSIWNFNNKMNSIKEDEDIELEINSYGGDVFLGIDIMNTLRGHKGKVTITITGIAASAASIIAMGADEIQTYSNAQMMVHYAWTLAMGNAKELRKIADDLESINESVIASYTHRADEETVRKLLDEETYLSAGKAKEYGLVDTIVDEVAEEVESEIFSNEAKKFNATISKNDKKLESKIFTLEGEIIQLKEKLKNPTEEPKKVAKRKGFFF